LNSAKALRFNGKMALAPGLLARRVIRTAVAPRLGELQNRVSRWFEWNLMERKPDAGCRMPDVGCWNLEFGK
jgi:hypothetical protein